MAGCHAKKKIFKNTGWGFLSDFKHFLKLQIFKKKFWIFSKIWKKVNLNIENWKIQIGWLNSHEYHFYDVLIIFWKFKLKSFSIFNKKYKAISWGTIHEIENRKLKNTNG